MAIKNNWNNPDKQARLEMEYAERQASKNLPTQAEKRSGDASAKPEPKRYKLYEKINVSLKTMDIIVASIAILLVVLIIVGIVIG